MMRKTKYMKLLTELKNQVRVMTITITLLLYFFIKSDIKFYYTRIPAVTQYAVKFNQVITTCQPLTHNSNDAVYYFSTHTHSLLCNTACSTEQIFTSGKKNRTIQHTPLAVQNLLSKNT